ncbi:hypothetical protein D3C72_331110 [compost metagenome]
MHELRCRQVWLVHFHEVDVDEERFVGLRRRVEKFQRGFFHVVVKERNTDDTGFSVHHRRVDVLSIDLEFLHRLFTGLGGKRALGHFGKHGAGFFIHVREPGRVGVGVGIEVIQADVFHHVVTLGIWQGVVGFAQMPFAGEIGLIATGFQHRGQCPFSRRQTTALTLEGHRGHAAAVGDAPGLHGCPAGGATGLGIKRKEGSAFLRQLVDAGRRHAATDTAAIGPEVTVAGIVGYDKQDVGFFCLCSVTCVDCHE